MTRLGTTLTFVTLLSLPALAEPSVSLVDGRRMDGRLVSIEKKDGAMVATVGVGEGMKTVPARLLVNAMFDVPASRPSPNPFNIYLADGDRLRGTVVGTGDVLALESKQLTGFKTPLARVDAVCVGTFFGQVQANYRALFDRQRNARPLRDSVVVNRGSKPFSFRAVVLDVKKASLGVRMGDQQRELPRDKVYGFVRASGEPAEIPEGIVMARTYLSDGGRITVPVEAIDAESIRGGGLTIHRKNVMRIEFTGTHVANLADMTPVSTKEVALFGKAPKWRRNEMIMGGTLRLDGVKYASGIGVQAMSKLEFVLGARWDKFYALAGIDDAASAEGKATFRVLGDGKVLAEVTRRRGEKPAVLSIDVRGVDRLVLEALPGDSFTSDLCNWAEARVYNGNPEK